MVKTVIVDIDNTLWDFATVLYEKLKKVNSELPEVSEWHCWDFWKPYISRKDFYFAINEIHREQDKYGVFADAKDFLDYLKSKNYNIVIASQRELRSKQATLNWLQKHKLLFDELHLLSDKSVLFNNNVFAVVDDSPHVLSKARENNLVISGIKFPWNKEHHDYLFECLIHIKNNLL